MRNAKKAYVALKLSDAARQAQQASLNRKLHDGSLATTLGGVKKHEHSHTKYGVDAIDTLLNEGALALTTRGDLTVMGATDIERLAIGAANTVLQSDGTDMAWVDIIEDTPTEDEANKAPSSEWAFDHEADVDGHHPQVHADEHKWLGSDEVNIKDLALGTFAAYRVVDLSSHGGWTHTIIGNGILSAQFGISVLNINTGATGEVGLISKNGFFQNYGSFQWRLSSFFVMKDVADIEMWCGFFAANNARPTDTSNHYAFKLVDDNLYASCGNGSNGTQELIAAGINVNQSLKCYIKYMPDGIHFFFNGTELATLTDYRPQSLNLFPGWWLYGKVTDDQKQVHIYGMQLLQGED